MKKYSFLLILAVIIIAYFTNEAEAGAFDSISLNARPIGMGEAFTSVMGGLDSVRYNPAGLAKVYESQLLMSYRDFYNLRLVNQKYAGFAVPGRYINFGLSWHRIGTTSRVSFMEYKEDIYSLAMAGKIKKIRNLFGGADFKFYRVFSQSNASGYGIDLGMYYEMFYKKLSIGFKKSLNKKRVYWDTGVTDKLENDFRLGMCVVPLKNCKLALDTVNGLEKLNFGLEIGIIGEIFKLRTGIKNANKAYKILCMGMGLSFGDINIDYALTKHRYLDLTHFFSLYIKISRH
ncbi:hypothetical protein ACFLUV_02210 [Elusimicrobiota bacterium]